MHHDEGIAPLSDPDAEKLNVFQRIWKHNRKMAGVFLAIGIGLVLILIAPKPGTPNAADVSAGQIAAAGPAGGRGAAASTTSYLSDLMNNARGATFAPPAEQAPSGRSGNESQAAPPQQTEADRIRDDILRRKHEARFGSGVVAPLGTQSAGGTRQSAQLDADASRQPAGMPSLSDIAAAARDALGGGPEPPRRPEPVDARPPAALAEKPVPGTFRPGPAQSLHRISPGKTIETTLEDELVGAGPINVLVSVDVYAHDQTLVIPQGSHIIGEAARASETGEDRMGVVFTTIVLTDGRELDIDNLPGMNQAGDSGLKGKVNHHLLPAFAAATAFAVIGGLGQAVGNIGRGDGGISINENIGQSTAQVSSQAASRYTNPIPTVTIPAGHRVRVYLRSHLDLPAWVAQ